MSPPTYTPVRADNVRQLELPAPQIASVIERITPRMAEQILSNNPLNRVVKEAPLAKYTSDMRSGQFKSLNGETIVINKHGGLEDGQHRLLALIESGLPFLDFLVVRGVEPRSNETIDQGAQRTAADAAAMRGYECTRVLIAAVRWCWTYNHAWPQGLSSTRALSTPKLLEYLDANSHIAYASTEVRKEYPRACGLLMGSIAVFTRVITDAIDPQQSNDFFRALETGETTYATRQVLKLRDKLIAREARKHRLRAPEIIIVTIRCWNAMRHNRELSSLIVARNAGDDRENPYRNAPRFE